MSEVSETEGKTILYVSHNMNTIRSLCDRCIVLDEGKVIFDGEVEEAINIYLGEYREIKGEYLFSKKSHKYNDKNLFRFDSIKMTKADKLRYD